MRVTAENLVRQELIGLHARIVWSTHKGYVGMEGPIIMESRNMIVLGTKNSTPTRIPKKSVILDVSIPDNGRVRIDGNEIIGRPENRIKMKKRKSARRL